MKEEERGNPCISGGGRKSNSNANSILLAQRIIDPCATELNSSFFFFLQKNMSAHLIVEHSSMTYLENHFHMERRRNYESIG